jgi:hypothetical protein
MFLSFLPRAKDSPNPWSDASLRPFQNFTLGKSLSRWFRADLSRSRFRAALRRLAVMLFQRGLGADFAG